MNNLSKPMNKTYKFIELYNYYLYLQGCIEQDDEDMVLSKCDEIPKFPLILNRKNISTIGYYFHSEVNLVTFFCFCDDCDGKYTLPYYNGLYNEIYEEVFKDKNNLYFMEI